MLLVQGAQRAGDATHNDGQFIVEIVGGCGGYGAGAIGIAKWFHSRKLPRRYREQTFRNPYQIES